MNRPSCFLVLQRLFAASCIVAPCAATAAVPADLDTLPLPIVCYRVFVGLGDIADERDQGVSKKLVLERNRTAHMDVGLPEKLIENVFAYRNLNRSAVETYATWSCHANGHGLPALPLSQVHADMSKCFAKPAGDACVRTLRDRVLGIRRGAAAQPAADTPDMVAMRRTPTNKAPPQDR